MLLEAIFGIIAISIVFCCCTFCCYLFFHFLFTEGKSDVQPETEVWEAKHYYDPLPLSTPSPPDTIFKPTPYTFKLQNGNGVYSTALPHAVINPAVLQYPPGHVLDQQRVPSLPAEQQKPPRREKSQSNNHVDEANPGRAKNVWSTNTEFQQPHYYYDRQYHHHQQQQQQQNAHYPPEIAEYAHPPQQRHRQEPVNHQPKVYYQQQKHYSHDYEDQPIIPFMASSHATNAYTHHQRYKSRLKEAIT